MKTAEEMRKVTMGSKTYTEYKKAKEKQVKTCLNTICCKINECSKQGKFNYDFCCELPKDLADEICLKLLDNGFSITVMEIRDADQRYISSIIKISW